MTTEELENKLKISEKTCIHCTTLELAKQVLNIFHQLGLKWSSGNHYIRYTNWDNYRENTVYYPFEGEFSSLRFAHFKGYKVIKAKEFIALHTEKEKFDLENYIPKGQLEGFPKEIIARMLNYQEEQGNPRDISVFEKQCEAGRGYKGFNWAETQEKCEFWYEVIRDKNFNLFFEKYPKQEYQELKNNKNMQENNKKEDNSQEFRIGDNVIDIITRQRGKIFRIDTNNKNIFIVYVNFNEEKNIYTLDGRLYFNDKYPRLLHYRDDYDYSVIDFNNLPKRQEVKRWRAEEGQRYYYINTYFEVHSFEEEYHITDTKLYNLGDYFQTEKEAQEMADKLKKYFQELINPNK